MIFLQKFEWIFLLEDSKIKEEYKDLFDKRAHEQEKALFTDVN